MTSIRKTHLALLFLSILYLPVSYGIPLADIKMRYIANEDGTFTYMFRIKNMGPPSSPLFATPSGHTITNWQNGSQYPAGGKELDDDKNIVLFGIDTGDDNVTISHITNGSSDFTGSEEQGFNDSDNDQIPDKVIGWHLPFDFNLKQAIHPGKSLHHFSFTLNKEIKHFQYWIGGSDDNIIWIEDNDGISLEDAYGIFYATTSTTKKSVYLATFLTRSLTAEQIKAKPEHED